MHENAILHFRKREHSLKAWVRRLSTSPKKPGRELPRVRCSSGRKKGLLAILPFLGPAFIACVAYIDPGNFATNIRVAAAFGYKLLWVIALANLMAMLLQTMSAKLGLATGKNLAELCRQEFRKPVVYAMWIVSEFMAMATDLAEFLGASIAINLLFGIPLLPATLITGVATYLILTLERRGFRPLEVVIGVLVGVIAVCYVIETFFSRPNWGQVGYPYRCALAGRDAEHPLRGWHYWSNRDATCDLPALLAYAATHHPAQ